ncbi:MAG: hypothetical protein H6739_31655 [Alphaproteobacteria bacterium]|nr:hypothetical protein [Alphaproteobacteria bacterium]
MSVRRITLAGVAALLLACAGLRDKDAVDSGPLPVTEACADYVDCAAAVEPATLGTLLESYGEGGTCWTSGADVAETCDGACVVGLEQLAELYPLEEACVGELPVCEEVEGDWEITLHREQTDCDDPEDPEITSAAEIQCVDRARGRFDIEFERLTASPSECTATGSDFVCTFEVQVFQWEMEGRFDGLERAEGSYSWANTVCGAQGTFELVAR